MPNIARILVPLDSQDRGTFAVALAHARRIAAEAEVSNLILLTHTKAQLDGTGLSQFVGAATAKALSKGQPVRLSSGGSLQAETLKTLKFNTARAVVIAYYADEKLLDFADALHGTPGIVALPWVAGEADNWAMRWNATIHGQSALPIADLIDDPVVVRALQALTSAINLSTGLAHPRDKDKADEIFRILRAKGHSNPSANIKSWAIRNNWSPKAASELEALAKKIWSLATKPRLTEFNDPDVRYASWTSET